MIRRFHVAALALVFGAVVVATLEGRAGKPPPAPDGKAVAWPVYDLPRAMFNGGVEPPLVRVAFTHRPTPTADPLVWLYHPTSPPLGPPYYEIRFARPPQWKDAAPFRVEGSPRLRRDTDRRLSRVPGTVILLAASLRSGP